MDSFPKISDHPWLRAMDITMEVFLFICHIFFFNHYYYFWLWLLNENLTMHELY